MTISMRRPKYMERILEECKAHFVLGPDTDHGPSHWEQVEENAIYLANRTPGADMKVVRLFSIIHDCCRRNEYHDEAHGMRAENFMCDNVRRWKLKLTRTQFSDLCKAVGKHEDGNITDNPTIGVCWDADRLDLPRVGIKINPKYLSTQAAKDRVDADQNQQKDVGRLRRRSREI